MPGEPVDVAPEPDPYARLKEKLALVRRRFVAGFDDRLSELIGLARVAGGEPGRDADLARQSLGRGLHSIAGSAPTIGLTELGAKARELEVELARGSGSGRAPNADFLADLAALAPLARLGET